MKRIYISPLLFFVIMLLFASCGQQHKAESLVENFLEEHLIEAKYLNSIEFHQLDSTYAINDSIILNMHKRFIMNQKYKKGWVFGKKKKGQKLMFIRVNYSINNHKYSDTYYINPEMTDVVAIKNNGL